MEESVVISVDQGRNIIMGGGSHRTLTSRTTTTTRWPTPEEIVSMTKFEATEEEVRANERAFLSSWWDHKIFFVARLLAVLIDPVYLYVSFVNDMDCSPGTYSWFVIQFSLRTATDFCYFVDFVLYCVYMRRVQRKLKATTVSLKTKTKKRRRIRKFIIAILYRLLLALPIPVLIVFRGFIGLFFLTVQHLLKVYDIYGSLRLIPNVETGTGRWLKAILDFFPFVLAAHLLGAVWYVLAVYRENECWAYACRNNRCGESELYRLYGCSFEHELGPNITTLNIINEFCSRNATVYDYGIYLYAHQSGMTSSSNVLRKMLQGFWWALQNLSSFGSNLHTTYWYPENRGTRSYILEIFFSIFLSISGIALFLIYLNERVQVFKIRSKEHKLRQKMQKLNPEIDLWLSKNSLPKSLKMEVTDKLRQKLDENINVDVNNVLSIILRNSKNIMSHLRLASVQKVPEFENLNDRVLRAICGHLKPVIYAEDKFIIREGEPLDKMLFITQGTAWSYNGISNTTNAYVGTSCSSIIRCLEKGDLFGEEILEWATKLNSFSEFPISTKVVKSQTNVEAFAIRATDLKSVVFKFWWHFYKKELHRLNDPQVQQRWQRLAVSIIEAQWRCRRPAKAC